MRNQQFQLGTIALAGSGITAWLAPAIIALQSRNGEAPIPGWVLVLGIFFWLLLLAILFWWAMSLRSLISIISQYLTHSKLSLWEPRFRLFQEPPISCQGIKSRYYASQTLLSTVSFLVYGLIPVASAILFAQAFPKKIIMTCANIVVLILLSGFYALCICVYCKTREHGDDILEVWKGVSKTAEWPPQVAAEQNDDVQPPGVR